MGCYGFSFSLARCPPSRTSINPNLLLATFETNWKESALTFDPRGVAHAKNLRSRCSHVYRAVPRLRHRGIARTSGWRAGVYPRSADLPILCRNEVHACDQDEAVIEAMDRVDGVLRR